MLRSLENCSSFLEVWSRAVSENPDGVAFIAGGERYTYYEVERMSESFAASLANDFGIERGTPVAMVLPNSIPFIVAYLGIQKAGALPVPLNTRLKGEQFDSLFNLVKPAAVIVDDRFRRTIEPLLEAHREIRYRIGVDVDEPDWDSFYSMTSGMSGDPPDFPLSPDDPAVVLFTSGTTGDPRGAVIRHGDLLWNIKVTGEVFDFGPSDVHMLTVPLFHCTGLESIFPASVFHGSACVLDEQIAPSYLFDLIEGTGATTFITVPTVLYLLISWADFEPERLSSLRLIGFSGAPMRTDALRKLHELLPDVELVNFYGLTETTSIITCCRGEEIISRPDSIGRPCEGVDVRIARRGEPLPAGGTGELQIHRRNVISAYFGAPGELEKRFAGDWFRTGDLAARDEEGFFFLKGRNIDLIIVGGENVFAGEVERVLDSHPQVRESAVVGVPNKVFGEVVKAFVVPYQRGTADPLALKKFCFERLPSYKVPIEIEFLDELPRTPSGKVKKDLLRKSANR